jgi:PfaB family protein
VYAGFPVSLCESPRDESARLHAGAEAALVNAGRSLNGAAILAVSTAGNVLGAALSKACVLLNSGEYSAVVLVEDAPGWGTSAVVLELESAGSRGTRAYARLDALEGPVAVMADRIAAAIECVLQSTGVSAADIGTVEMTAVGKHPAAVAETAGLVRALRTPGLENSCAVSTLSAGHSAPLAAFVKACLCLWLRVIPAMPAWQGPELPAVWKDSPFYAPLESRAWFTRSGRKRRALISTVGTSVSLALLSEGSRPAPDPAEALLERGSTYCFPLCGHGPDELLAQAGSLAVELDGRPGLAGLADECLRRERARRGEPFALALVAGTPDELRRELELAVQALPGAFENGRDWQTPQGSCFTPAPLGAAAGIAFVYPGAFNSYPGIGRDLFFLFPDLHERLAGLSADLSKTLCAQKLYPRSLDVLTSEALAEIEAGLNADPIAMLASGTTLAVIYTRILRENFGIQPQAALGYSLGENSMMFAMGVWGDGDGPYARLEQSPAFRTRLAGPQNAVRRVWGLPELSALEPAAQPLWSSFVLMARPDDVRTALQDEPRVYLTHVNTPRQVVIAGDPDGCRRVIAALKCTSLKAPFDYALHCEAMRSEEPELARLHTWPVLKDPGVRLYTAAAYAPVVFEPPGTMSEIIAANVGKALCSPLDFPRLVQAAYDGGARVFIELGAGSNCSRWIDECLKGRPHAALAVNRRGATDDASLARLLAKLWVQRVAVSRIAVSSQLSAIS